MQPLLLSLVQVFGELVVELHLHLHGSTAEALHDIDLELNRLESQVELLTDRAVMLSFEFRLSSLFQSLEDGQTIELFQ